MHRINNDIANKHANGKQKVSQTESKRYTNNIVNKGNRVNMEKKKPLIKRCPICYDPKKADRDKPWDCICDKCGVQMVDEFELELKKPKKNTKSKANINQQSKTRKKQNKKSTNIDNVHYTIQVAAWPSLEHARLDQLKLIEEGMDAYIQRHYRNEDDQVWYRVRIGNFKSKENASIVQKQIESITHAKTWLDILPSGQK